MGQIDRLISAENIARYVDQLDRALSLDVHASLQQRLLEEENRYGLLSWHLDLVEQRIAEAADRIDKQTARLRQLEDNAMIHRVRIVCSRPITMCKRVICGYATTLKTL